MVTITDKAMIKLREISEAEGIGHYSIRASVKGGGCAGMTHDLCFDNQFSELDEIFEYGEIKIVLDPVSYQYLQNVEIDYVENSISSGFKFISSDIKGSCGCGNSVSY